jgi:hypothetical protein
MSEVMGKGCYSRRSVRDVHRFVSSLLFTFVRARGPSYENPTTPSYLFHPDRENLYPSQAATSRIKFSQYQFCLGSVLGLLSTSSQNFPAFTVLHPLCPVPEEKVAPVTRWPGTSQELVHLRPRRNLTIALLFGSALCSQIIEHTLGSR